MESSRGMSKNHFDAIIACAMEEESAPFVSALRNRKENSVHSIEGAIAGKRVLLLTTGIGLTNAAIAATNAGKNVSTDLYILAGSCGGLGEQVRVGDVVAGTFAQYSFADATAFGYEMGQIPGMPVRYESRHKDYEIPADHVGLVLSGNSFVTADIAEAVRDNFPLALAVDMETAAAAQVAYRTGIESWCGFSVNMDWLCLRAVSDLCGPRAGEDFHIGLDIAAVKSRDAVVTYLEEL